MLGPLKNYLDLKPSGFNSMPYKYFNIHIGRTGSCEKQSRRNMSDICFYTNQTAQRFIEG
jgi:hypothetical protein